MPRCLTEFISFLTHEIWPKEYSIHQKVKMVCNTNHISTPSCPAFPIQTISLDFQHKSFQNPLLDCDVLVPFRSFVPKIFLPVPFLPRFLALGDVAHRVTGCYRILDAFGSSLSGQPWTLRNSMECLSNNLSKYLSKYLSKSSSPLNV